MLGTMNEFFLKHDPHLPPLYFSDYVFLEALIRDHDQNEPMYWIALTCIMRYTTAVLRHQIGKQFFAAGHQAYKKVLLKITTEHKHKSCKVPAAQLEPIKSKSVASYIGSTSRPATGSARSSKARSNETDDDNEHVEGEGARGSKTGASSTSTVLSDSQRVHTSSHVSGNTSTKYTIASGGNAEAGPSTKKIRLIPLQLRKVTGDGGGGQTSASTKSKLFCLFE